MECAYRQLLQLLQCLLMSFKRCQHTSCLKSSKGVPIVDGDSNLHAAAHQPMRHEGGSRMLNVVGQSHAHNVLMALHLTSRQFRCSISLRLQTNCHFVRLTQHNKIAALASCSAMQETSPPMVGLPMMTSCDTGTSNLQLLIRH